MSDIQVGRYIRLLCLQANKGHVSEKDMLFICKTYDEEVFLKFDKTENGNFANKILSEILEQRKAYTQSRRDNRKGKEKNDISSTYDNHMVNVDVNVILDDSNKELCLKILRDFKFNEIANFDKLRQISEFVSLLKFNNRFEYFETQYDAYWIYKGKHPDEKTQGLKPFLEGGWENKNWIEETKPKKREVNY